jgi:hypothetical protein
MFKDVASGFSKFFTKERVLILVVVLILIWALTMYSGSKNTVYDNYEPGLTNQQVPLVQTSGQQAIQQQGKNQNQNQNVQQQNGYNTVAVANPTDLLPKDSNSQWAALNPNTMNQGDILMPDLLQAGYHIGLDTIGQTLRNANLQLRSDPIIPRADVGPWNQSTIEPDLGRVPLELGNCPK